jgi:hypothetical protein
MAYEPVEQLPSPLDGAYHADAAGGRRVMDAACQTSRSPRRASNALSPLGSMLVRGDRTCCEGRALPRPRRRSSCWKGHFSAPQRAATGNESCLLLEGIEPFASQRQWQLLLSGVWPERFRLPLARPRGFLPFWQWQPDCETCAMPQRAPVQESASPSDFSWMRLQVNR